MVVEVERKDLGNVVDKDLGNVVDKDLGNVVGTLVEFEEGCDCCEGPEDPPYSLYHIGSCMGRNGRRGHTLAVVFPAMVPANSPIHHHHYTP